MAVEVKIEPRNDRELVLARLMDATPEALFRCWTDPELMVKWFAPAPLTTKVISQDLRVGGEQQVLMSDGTNEYPAKGVFLEIVPGARLAFTDAYSAGWVPNENPMMTAVLTFEAQADGKTLYIARAGHMTAEAKAQHETMGFHEGWGLCAEQLEAVAKTL